MLQFILRHPRFSLWVVSLFLVPLLVYGCDDTVRLTGAEIEQLLADEPALMCVTSGEPLTEYFVANGAYHLDLPGSTRDRFGHLQVDDYDRVCIAVAGEVPECRYVWRNGDSFSWGWVNPTRFADFSFTSEDPCLWGDEGA